MIERNSERLRRGMTLLEVMLALTLLVIVTAKVSMAFDAAADSNSREMDETMLEERATHVMRQIAFAIMESSEEMIAPASTAPLSTSGVKYQVSLGIEDGAVIWSDPEKIALEELQRQVYWSDNPDVADERRVVWTNLVAPFLEGELPNGMDDNGNGLIDEKGLCFSMDGRSVELSLTLERVLEDGEVLTMTKSTVVACRNKRDGWGVVQQ